MVIISSPRHFIVISSRLPEVINKDVAPYQRCSRRWVWRGRRSMCVIQFQSLILQRDSVPSVMVDLNS